MKQITGFEGLYTIAKDYTIIEIATGDIVKPIQDVKGVLHVKLIDSKGHIKRRKLTKLYLEHYNEAGTDNDIIAEVKALHAEGIYNAKFIANKLNVPLKEIIKTVAKLNK